MGSGHGLPDFMSPDDARIFGIRLEDFGKMNFRDGSLWPYFGSATAVLEAIFSCPSDQPPRYARQYLLPKVDLKYPRNFSYNFSGYMGGSPRKVPPAGPSDWKGLRLTMVRRPSHKIMVIEEEMPRGTAGSVLAANGSDSPPIVVLLTRRHSGMANEGFFDGHVELIDPHIFRGTTADIFTVDAFHIHVNVFSDR